MADARCGTHAGSLFHRIPEIGSMICAVLILVALILSIGFAGTSYAAHPLVTDDTGTQGKGRFQFELNGEFRRNKGAQDGIFIREDAGESAAVFSAGVTDNVDVIIGLPWVYSQVKENGTLVSNASGLGDMTLEAKWRFFAREGFSLAVKPVFSVPTGNEEKGFGNGRTSYGVTLILEQEWEGLFVSGNGAYTRNEFRLEADRQTNRRDIWQANLAAGVELVKGLQAVANIGTETNADRGSSQWPSFLLGGVIYSVMDDIDIDVGAKWGLNRAEPVFAVMAGIAWRF